MKKRGERLQMDRWKSMCQCGPHGKKKKNQNQAQKQQITVKKQQQPKQEKKPTTTTSTTTTTTTATTTTTKQPRTDKKKEDGFELVEEFARLGEEEIEAPTWTLGLGRRRPEMAM